MNIAEANLESYPEEVNKAQELLKRAIALDSEFANAYAWLASIYMNNLYQHRRYRGKRDIVAAFACTTRMQFTESWNMKITTLALRAISNSWNLILPMHKGIIPTWFYP